MMELFNILTRVVATGTYACDKIVQNYIHTQVYAKLQKYDQDCILVILRSVPDCTDSSILAVMVFYSFVKCHHRGDSGKG